MDNVKHIFKKEFKAYFLSPIAYIVISVFLIIIGWLFFSTFFLDRQASLTRFFSLLPITFALIIPAVTMRLFSEEINVGSYELLLTLPPQLVTTAHHHSSSSQLITTAHHLMPRRLISTGHHHSSCPSTHYVRALSAGAQCGCSH